MSDFQSSLFFYDDQMNFCHKNVVLESVIQ